MHIIIPKLIKQTSIERGVNLNEAKKQLEIENLYKRIEKFRTEEFDKDLLVDALEEMVRLSTGYC